MEYQTKPSSSTKTAQVTATPLQPPQMTPARQAQRDADQQRTQQWQAAQTLFTFTGRPVDAQRQVIRPVLTAASLNQQETQRVEGAHPALQRQVQELAQTYPPAAVQAALQRQQRRTTPTPVIRQPQSTADWVTVMRQQAEQTEGRAMTSSAFEDVKALQRQVARRLSGGYRQDRQVPAIRTAQYAQHLMALQRHPISAQVARVVMTQIPPGERPALQRAVDEALQREAAQQAQDAEATGLPALQRQLAELDEQAMQPVAQRIQARRGAGNPLPEAVQRHLEGGLNHDLGAVRIHDDAEADTLAKSVSATAFTTGTDIFFRAGRFNPNTRSGLELLAHEVTHTVQQCKGLVGRGIDPDEGLEAEARKMGTKLAGVMPSPKSLMPPNPHAPGVYTHQAAVGRAQDASVRAALHHPFQALGFQALGVQRQAAGGLTIQRNFVLDKVSELAANIPGYRQLCLVFGKDLVTGRAMAQNPNAILDALAGWVPGPLKEMLRAVRQQNLIPKAWAWFQGEVGKLQLGSVLSEVKGAIGKFPPDLGAARAALTQRAEGLKSLVAGSARHIAQIALSAIEAGLGPVGKKVMARLRKSGDVIMQIIRDPAKFAGHLITALRQGFTQFSTNSGRWLKNGLGQWLTGASGFAFPATLDVKGVFMTALSIMGLTYQAMRGKLVAQLGAGGAQKVAAAEKAGGALTSLSRGLHTSPELMGHQAAVGKSVVDGLKTEVTTSLVTAGAAKVASMLIPGGAFVQALLTAFQTVQTLINQSAQIMGVITSALGSVGAIAAGQVGAAAGFIERTIGGSIPIVLTFLGKVIGLRNIGSRIKATVNRLKARLDGVIDKIIARVKGVIGAGKTAVGNTAAKAKTFISGIFGKKNFTGGKQAHSVWVESKNNQSTLMIASTPMEAEQQLRNFAGTARTQLGADPQGIYSRFIQPRLVYATKEIQAEKRKLQLATSTLPATERTAKMEMGVRASNITTRVADLTGHLLDEIARHVGNTYTMPTVTLAFPLKSGSGRRYNKHELMLQLAEQETALRRMTVQEWLRRYPFYPGATKSGKAAVKKLDATARARYRDTESARLIADLAPRLVRQYLSEGLPGNNATRDRADAEARRQVAAFMSGQAALHMPDKISGGHYLLDINGMGDTSVNSFIGSQWKSSNKVGSIKAACDLVPVSDRTTTHLNIRLEAR